MTNKFISRKLKTPAIKSTYSYAYGRRILFSRPTNCQIVCAEFSADRKLKTSFAEAYLRAARTDTNIYNKKWSLQKKTAMTKYYTSAQLYPLQII